MRSPLRLARAELPTFDDTRHQQLWGDVPPLWRRHTYPLGQEPFSQVFVGLNRTRTVTLEVESLSETLQQEFAWWVWHCYQSGDRRINLVWLRNIVYALVHLQRRRPALAVTSLLQVSRTEVQHAFQEYTYSYRGQLPAPASTRNTDRETTAFQEALALRHDQVPWWQQDTWSCRADARIPVREHEPQDGQSIRFTGLETTWLRGAVKYYFRIMLETRHHTWGTLLTVLVSFKYFDEFVRAHAVTHRITGPALVEDPASDLHPLMLEFLDALRSRVVKAGLTRGGRLSDRTVIQAQLHVGALYLFMTDHCHELATATNDPRFAALTDRHSRLWRPSDLPSGRGPVFGDADGSQYIADTDLSKMTELITLVGLPRDQVTTVVIDGEIVPVHGLGDPSVMRAWLIQALTGRRASEILMSDFNPLQDVPGLTPAPNHPSQPGQAGPAGQGDGPDGEQFVARFRYQQTKVRQAPTSIIVGLDVVNLIREQQAWTRRRLRLTPDQPDPRYLFPALNENHHGTRHRPAASYALILSQLTALVRLKDQHGRLIEFSHSHRLRHTKATNLLNLGAPIHVVVRYMGHRSPEMTMHYAATLAHTAEREFLRTQRVGHDGKVLGVSAQDLYDMTALSQRTDRVLPTGLCLLPPTKRCDKGNACYGCDFFATDRSHLKDHRELVEDTRALIARRQAQVLERTGRPMSEDNIWLSEQHATLRSLALVITALEEQGAQDTDPPRNHSTTTTGIDGGDAAASTLTRRGCGVRGRDGYQPGPTPHAGPVPVTITPRQATP